MLHLTPPHMQKYFNSNQDVLYCILSFFNISEDNGKIKNFNSHHNIYQNFLFKICSFNIEINIFSYFFQLCVLIVPPSNLVTFFTQYKAKEPLKCYWTDCCMNIRSKKWRCVEKITADSRLEDVHFIWHCDLKIHTGQLTKALIGMSMQPKCFIWIGRNNSIFK